MYDTEYVHILIIIGSMSVFSVQHFIFLHCVYNDASQLQLLHFTV
jgi:hypothetical protein